MSAVYSCWSSARALWLYNYSLDRFIQESADLVGTCTLSVVVFIYLATAAARFRYEIAEVTVQPIIIFT